MRARRFIPCLMAFLFVLGAAAVAAGTGTAASISSDVSSNWAGYSVAAPVEPASGALDPFSSVSGAWVQPAARCTASGGASSAAFWVGLGGDSSTSSALEQVGTESDCGESGTASYSAWYELVPAASAKIHLKVAAGDRIAAAVAVDGTKVTVKLADVTTGASFAKTLAMAAPDTTSAEWIAEAPSLCASLDSTRCRQASLTDFGKVSFSKSRATTVGGIAGSISNPAWPSATALELDASRSFGYHRFGMQSPSAQAIPGPLASSGSAFTIAWSEPQPTEQPPGYAPGYGPDPGYGYGY